MGLFSGILGAVGGILGLNSSKKAASQEQANWQAQHQLAVDQFEFQKDYTKNRIQWQIEDAKKAGLHPMAAVGLSPTSFSPVSSSPGNPVQPLDYSWVGNLGQNLDYASAKGKTSFQQAKALQLTTEAAQLQNDGLRLDNELKQMEIMSMLSRLVNSGPAAPSLTGNVSSGIDGQPDSLVAPESMRTTPHTETGKEPGSNPSVGWIQNHDGSLVPVMSEAAKERLEDDTFGTTLWNLRNRVAPHVKTMFGRSVSAHTPPNSLLPRGAVRWEYAGYGEYVPVDSKGNRVRPSR